MIVEGRGQRLLVGEDEGRRAPDQGHVLVAEANEGHLLRDEAQHVGAGGNVRLAHGAPA